MSDTDDSWLFDENVPSTSKHKITESVDIKLQTILLEECNNRLKCGKNISLSNFNVAKNTTTKLKRHKSNKRTSKTLKQSVEAKEKMALNNKLEDKVMENIDKLISTYSNVEETNLFDSINTEATENLLGSSNDKMEITNMNYVNNFICNEVQPKTDELKNASIITIEDDIEPKVEKEIVDEKKENRSCSICLEDLVENISATICGHIFHTDCLSQSFRSARCCPICRKRLTAKQFHPLFF